MYRYVTVLSAAQFTHTNDLIELFFLDCISVTCQCVNMCRSVDFSYLKSSLFPMSQAVGWQTTLRPSSGFTSMDFSQKLGNIW